MTGAGGADVGLYTQRLSCGYASDVPILNEVSLSLRNGRFVCVIGPNGIGKSTLMRTISGLLRPLSGTVEIGGRRIEALSARERARELSVVLTGQRAPGYMSVQRYVEIGRYPHISLLGAASQTDLKAVEAALSASGVRQLAGRRVAELSDGERQRVAIARALAQSSRVMILDEPTAFLDVSARASTMVLLRRTAHESGRLVITSSHEIELVLRTADTVVLIRPDRTICSGSPEDLVLGREIDHLFSGSSLEFDYERGSFRLPQTIGTPVRVIGSGERAIWTQHALERIGFTIADHSDVSVQVSETDTLEWTLAVPDAQPATVFSLEQLADRLRD